MNRVIEETNELDDSRQFVYDGGLLVRLVLNQANSEVCA